MPTERSKVIRARVTPEFHKMFIEDYCKPRGISEAEAVRAALIEVMSMAGISFRQQGVKP